MASLNEFMARKLNAEARQGAATGALTPADAVWLAKWKREQEVLEGMPTVEWPELLALLSKRIPEYVAGTSDELWIALTYLNFPRAGGRKFLGTQNGRDQYGPIYWSRPAVRQWLHWFDRVREVVAPPEKRAVSLR